MSSRSTAVPSTAPDTRRSDVSSSSSGTGRDTQSSEVANAQAQDSVEPVSSKQLVRSLMSDISNRLKNLVSADASATAVTFSSNERRGLHTDEEFKMCNPLEHPCYKGKLLSEIGPPSFEEMANELSMQQPRTGFESVYSGQHIGQEQLQAMYATPAMLSQHHPLMNFLTSNFLEEACHVYVCALDERSLSLIPTMNAMFQRRGRNPEKIIWDHWEHWKRPNEKRKATKWSHT